MTQSEFEAALHVPAKPCTTAELLRELHANGEWRVDRILGSAGEFVVEVTNLMSHCPGQILCHHVTGDRYVLCGTLGIEAPAGEPVMRREPREVMQMGSGKRRIAR